MRILFDLTALAHNFSGIERFTLSLSTEIIRMFPQNTYVLIFKNNVHVAYTDIVKQQNVECVVVKGGNKLIFNQILLPFALYRHKADAYVFLSFPDPILFFKKNMYTAIYDVGCWDCGETMPALKRLYWRICFRKTMLFCKKIITVSQFSKQRIQQIGKLAPERICVAYGGLSSMFSLPEPASSTDIFSKYDLPAEYVLTLSTIEPRKNMQMLFSVYEELLKKGPVTDLVLVGRKGWMMDRYLSAISNELKAHLHFTGFVRDEDLSAIYQNAKYFVFPTKYEGFGLPPVEAMACGTPVLSSNAPCMPEVLGDAAMYFENNDPDDLEKKIGAMGSLSEGSRSRMIQNGLSQAKKYTWSASAEVIYKLIRSEESTQ